MSLKRTRSSLSGTLDDLKETIPFFAMKKATKHFTEADMEKQKAGMKKAMKGLEAWFLAHPEEKESIEGYLQANFATFKYTDMTVFALDEDELDGEFGDWLRSLLEPFAFDIESDDKQANTLMWKRYAAVFRLFLARCKVTSRIVDVISKMRASGRPKLDDDHAKALFKELKKQKSVWIKGGKDELDDDTVIEAKPKPNSLVKMDEDDEEDESQTSSDETSSGDAKTQSSESSEPIPKNAERTESSSSSSSLNESNGTSSSSSSEEESEKPKEKKKISKKETIATPLARQKKETPVATKKSEEKEAEKASVASTPEKAKREQEDIGSAKKKAKLDTSPEVVKESNPVVPTE